MSHLRQAWKFHPKFSPVIFCSAFSAASEEYGVYSGFITDPNGYFLEIQKFLNPDWSPGKSDS